MEIVLFSKPRETRIDQITDRYLVGINGKGVFCYAKEGRRRKTNIQ